MTSRTRWLILLVSTPLVLFVTVGGLLGASSLGGQQALDDQEIFGDVVSLVLRGYVEEVEPDRIMDGAMRGLVDSLDPSSAFLTPDEVRIIQNDTSPEPGGVGVVLSRQYYLRIVSVRDDSPADRAGLRSGDFIRAIDDTPTREMSVFTGTRRLRGAPGSTVRLLVIRGNMVEPHEVALIRERDEPASVTSRELRGGELLVAVPSFAPGTASAIRAAITGASEIAEHGVVIDLRDAAEGPIAEGIAAARLFVRQGVIARLDSREAAPVITDAGDGDGELTAPVVLVVSNGTAGAAEVFASALLRNARADLVGQPTAGLAAEQRLVALPEGHGLWLTHAQYMTSADEPIHGRGLAPTIAVDLPLVEFGEAPPADDETLDRAVFHLHEGQAG